MSGFRILRPWLCLLILALIPTSAWAQGSAGNKAAAEALFEEGRKLMQDQLYERACVKLEASQNLDAGLGTLMLLSDCYEKTGRTASAWATFREAAAVARSQGDEQRENVARTRADALEPNLAKLVVQGAASTMTLPGLEVKMAGQPLAKAQLGTPIPVDPGEVTFEVRAPGYKPWILQAQVVPGPSQTAIDIPELQPLPVEEPAAAPPPSTQPEQNTASSAPMAMEDQAEDSTLKTTGLVLGIAGVVGIGVGSFLGLKAKSKQDDSREFCNKTTCDSQEGLDLRDEAKSAATGSSIAFGLGGALLIAGGVLYFTSDGSKPESAKREVRWRTQLTPGGGNLSLEGSW